MALAVRADADTDVSGYGELRAGLGTSGLTDATYACVAALSINVQSCGSTRSHTSNTPTDLAAAFHVSAAPDAGLILQFDAEAVKRYLAGLNGRPYVGYANTGKVTKYGMGIHFDLAGDQYRAGGIVSMGNSDWTVGTPDFTNLYSNRLVTAGLEGARYLDRTTLFSQLTYSRSVQGYFAKGGAGLSSWYLYTGGRYFLRDNMMFEGATGTGFIDSLAKPNTRSYMLVGEGHSSILHWSAKVEYRFQDFPVSLVFNYQGSYGAWIKDTFDEGVYPYPIPYHYNRDSFDTWRRTEHLFLLSLRYYFGQDSLIANDRNGASMNDYNPWYGAEPVTEPFLGDANFLGRSIVF